MIQVLTRIMKPEYEEVYQAHYSKVLQYVYRKIGNFSEAEDLTSEVFLYAYKQYDQYDPSKSSIHTWLYLIVNSRLKNYYRDSKISVDLESIAGTLEDETVDLEKCVYLEEVSRQLHKAIAQLPERQRKIVQMRYFEERSCGEIATVMNMTSGSVRVQLSRALDKLESLYDNLLGGK